MGMPGKHTTSAAHCPNTQPLRVTAVCRMLRGNVQGLAGNLSDLTVALSQYDKLLYSETLVSNMRTGFGRPV